MSKILIKAAETIIAMAGDDLSGSDIMIEGGVIQKIGASLDATGAKVVEAQGCVVTPGLVNTHHHLFQTLAKAVPGGQDALLFGWLQTLYPIWARFGPDEMRVSTILGLSELALSGCSTSSDHLYLFSERLSVG